MKTIASFVGTFLIAAVAANPTAAQEADLVLRGGVVWTVDDDNSKAEAIASVHDRIVYVGPDDGVQQYIGQKTRVVDLDGKLVVPGFNDNHVHFEGTGRSRVKPSIIPLLGKNRLPYKSSGLTSRPASATSPSAQVSYADQSPPVIHVPGA